MKRKTVGAAVGLFAEQRRQEKVSQLFPVELRLNDLIPRELFREELLAVCPVCSRGGRLPNGEVLMFKRLILETLYSLSDRALEIEIYNRKSFRIFLGMNTALDVQFGISL